MDFRLTKEQEMMQKLCREFAVNEVEPIAAEIDEQERYPFETVEKMRKLGMMGIQFPKELGGSAAIPSAIQSQSKKHPNSVAQLAVSFRPMQHWAHGRFLSMAHQNKRKLGSVH